MSRLYEEVNPSQFVERGIMNVDDAAVRDNINALLTGAMMPCTLTPYIALEKVRKVLSYFHIHLPAVPFMEGDRGVQVFDVHQFGRLTGMRNDGEVVTKATQPYFIYFEYQQNDKGLFDVFCEVVTQDELDDLVDDAEEDINADTTEDDRDDKLNEAKSPEALDTEATLKAVTGNILSAIGAKRAGNRWKMKAHITSKKADKEDDEREARLYKEEKEKTDMASSLEGLHGAQKSLLGNLQKLKAMIAAKKKAQKQVKESSESVCMAGSETGHRSITGEPSKERSAAASPRQSTVLAKEEAKKVLKKINELVIHNPGGKSSTSTDNPNLSLKPFNPSSVEPGPHTVNKPFDSRRVGPGPYERKLPNRFDNNPESGPYERKLPNPTNPNGSQPDTSPNKSWDPNPAHTKPGGDSSGPDPFRGLTPHRRGDPGYGELSYGPDSMHGEKPPASTGGARNNIDAPSIKGPSSPSIDPSTELIKKPYEYGSIDPNKALNQGPYMKGSVDADKALKKLGNEKIQETSHESVNHVRRLAMKNKRNDR
jgi:hypothetical protein